MSDLRAALPWPAEHIATLRNHHNPCGWSCAASVDGSECQMARWLATLDAATPEPTLDAALLAEAIATTPGLSIGLMLPSGHLATSMEDIAAAILARLHERTET